MAGSAAGFFRGGAEVAQQMFVWGILETIIQALIQPALREMQQAEDSAFPNVPVTPADAAALVARALTDEPTAESIAKKSGIDPDNLKHLVNLARNSPSIGTIIAALQRGLIEDGNGDPETATLTGALADSGLRPEWWPIITKLAVNIPTGAEVMNAWLEGQITESEARTRWAAAGGDPTWFQTAYNANGSAPTPVQALEMWNRGIIPENGTGPDATSYEQAFLEGPWRNKWLDAFKALRIYYPPPRTITAMFHAGQLNHQQAADLLAKQGLQADMITAYLSPSQSSGTTAEKHLAKTDIVSLYSDGLMSRAQAVAALKALKYTAADADLLIELADVHTHTQQISAGVTRTRSLFLAGKLTEPEATADLTDLGVTADQAASIIATWKITQLAATREASESQIVSAWYYGIVTAEYAYDRLLSMGYDDIDAYIVMAARGHGPVQGLPVPAGLTLAPQPTGGAT